ncbi:uncharacterized protein LOC114326850 isoform X2 [Diabrotica virgifera virgifera]|nr:uncharacterized protein LOC114326850 isoform X2 [Diabrotica virgifera virgifera]XP_050502116.1 uncharacterized protein LOC114326850 isoform X2 [Diabrotica virgifera virgifera]XP_050502117.1 uncharacterized protein LOC114326850 isoform X2 [Diabrotica virgifera virgifera]
MMIYYAIVWLTIWNWNTAAQQSSQFEDIPIEHYVHNDHQNDEIDVELMPRSPKLLSIAQNSNPDTNIDTHNHRHPYFEELTSQIIKSRSKRDITTERPITVLEKIGQPLELFTVDKENTTDRYVNTSVIKKNETENNLNGTLQINDFLRFRRALQTDLVKQQNSRSQSAGTFIQADPHGIIGQSQILAGESTNTNNITRETRGATKEQWVKHSYPVQRDETNFDDNIQLASNSVRAPRVHFVTNGMQDRDRDRDRDRDHLEYKLNKEARYAPNTKYSPTDLSAEQNYYQPRFARNYTPRGRYYDRYPSAQRDSYRDYPEYNRNYEPESSSGPNRRRIIYYATLPEITRISRDDDFRRPYDNYDYRNRYDERYAPPEHYAYRDRLYDDPRQENDPKDRRDPRYPLRVSTDVRVNDIRKNPERRIYSDVDRAKYVPTR